MLKLIKERTPETLVDFRIEFTYKDDPNAGFCFPATPKGEPDYFFMPKEARANYEKCLTDDRLIGPEFTKTERTYMNPAVGKCSCGREVILDADYSGAVQCGCGQWYNLFGQELRDPRYWEEDEEY